MKRIVCAIDGTWVTAFATDKSAAYSNVFKLNLLLRIRDGNTNQIAFYVPGMGSRSSPLERVIGGVGRGLLDMVEETYVDICNNYEDGDEIYFFGFSRGAVVARFVADFISKFGVYRPEHVDKVRSRLQQHVFGEGRPAQAGQKGTWSAIQKRDPSAATYRDVPIKFLGVFDTVFGVNPFSDRALKKRAKADNLVPGAVEHAVQILALDEKRRRFQPQLWSRLQGQAGNRTLEQIWMPGVHGDIGGIYADDFLGNMALFTMLDRVMKWTDLAFHDIGALTQKHELVLRAVTSEDSSDFAVNGYSSLRDHVLNLLGKKRAFDPGNKGQYVSDLWGLLNSRGYRKRGVLRWREHGSGRYRLPFPKPKDCHAEKVDQARLGLGMGGFTLHI